MLWTTALCANLAIFVTGWIVAATISWNLTRGRQWSANPLAVGMFGIFAGCATGHGAHGLHLALQPSARGSYSADLLVFEAGTALALIVYTRKGRVLGGLARGGVLFEDSARRRLDALELNDNVVQTLAAARYALDRGDLSTAEERARTALVAARSLAAGVVPQGRLVSSRSLRLRLAGACR
jgi:hypothetical protein